MPEPTVTEQAINVVAGLGVLGGAAVLAVLVYLVALRTLFRLRRADRFAQEATERCRWPGRITVALLAVLAALPATDFPGLLEGRLAHLVTIVAIVSGTWWALRLAVAIEVTMLSSLDLTEGDTPRFRRRQTQVILIRRLIAAAIIMVAMAAVLLTFQEARSLGTSLLASAGIIGLVVGVAAQSTLSNVVAGIQIAVAEPVKLDDVVVIEGEWGNIEEISLTYVVVRTWDRRRLILPTSYFASTPFTNWSRNGTQIIGTIVWHLDHRAPVDEMRREFHRHVESHPLWDGDIAVLQVIDTDLNTIQVRAVVTASDSARLWDLRCGIREVMLAWVVDEAPEALPTTRLLEGAPTPESGRSFGPHAAPRPGPGPDTMPDPDPLRTQELPIGELPTPGATPRERRRST